MAKKRAAKGTQYQGGRPLQQQQQQPRNDVLPQGTVSARLSEVPVFGITVAKSSEMQLTSTGYYADEGKATFYMELRDAEAAVKEVPPGNFASVVGVPLGTVFFESEHRFQPGQTAVREMSGIPTGRMLVPDVSVPLYCIDGFQTSSKETGASSLPMFFSKQELLDFAKPVYGADDASQRVLLTDLRVVVTNMVQGPAGLLRNVRFFGSASALSSMDQLEKAKTQDLFGTGDSLEAMREGAVGGFRLPWQ